MENKSCLNATTITTKTESTKTRHMEHVVAGLKIPNPGQRRNRANKKKTSVYQINSLFCLKSLNGML